MNAPAEVNDVAPSSVSHVIGQPSVVEQVTVALDACQMDGKKFDSSLLVGGPGLGKSMIAQIIAAEMAVECQEVLGQSITSVGDLTAGEERPVAVGELEASVARQEDAALSIVIGMAGDTVFVEDRLNVAHEVDDIGYSR